MATTHQIPVLAVLGPALLSGLLVLLQLLHPWESWSLNRWSRWLSLLLLFLYFVGVAITSAYCLQQQNTSQATWHLFQLLLELFWLSGAVHQMLVLATLSKSIYTRTVPIIPAIIIATHVVGFCLLQGNELKPYGRYCIIAAAIAFQLFAAIVVFLLFDLLQKLRLIAIALKVIFALACLSVTAVVIGLHHDDRLLPTLDLVVLLVNILVAVLQLINRCLHAGQPATCEESGRIIARESGRNKGEEGEEDEEDEEKKTYHYYVRKYSQSVSPSIDSIESVRTTQA